MCLSLCHYAFTQNLSTSPAIKLIINLYFCLSQHVVFVVKFFVAWMIPDIPSEVKARVKRERYLVQEYLHNYEVEKLKVQLSQNGSGSQCICPEITATAKHEVLSECLT